ncbi:MAG: hypothetical protein IPM57_10775 [Oligoflexia bacterium]|nr:hypothetical protein [Oligoflexia bacterium]
MSKQPQTKLPRFKLARNLGFGDKEKPPFHIADDSQVIHKRTIQRLIETNVPLAPFGGYLCMCVYPTEQGFTIAVVKVTANSSYTGSNGKRLLLLSLNKGDACGYLQCLSAVTQTFDRYKRIKKILVNVEHGQDAFNGIKRMFQDWEHKPVIKPIDLSLPPLNPVLKKRVHNIKTVSYMAFLQGLVDGRVYLSCQSFLQHRAEFYDGINELYLKRTQKIWMVRNELAMPCAPILPVIAMGLLC